MAQVPSNLIPVSVSQLPVDPAPSDQSWIMVNNGGVSYRVQVIDLLSVSGVPTSRQVIAGTGLQGGGALSSNVTLSVAPGGISDTELSDTGATPGTFGSATKSAVFGVNAEGRIETTNEVDITPNVTLATGVLPLNRGGTGKSQTASPGSIAYGDAAGVALSDVGVAGQVLVSGGADAPTWGSALVISDQNANVVYAGPESGPAGATGFRALVNADFPLSGVTANTYGSATKAAVVTVNSKGIATLATETTITPAFSDVTGKPTTLSGYGITDAQPLDTTLTALAGVSTAADKLPYFTDVDTATTTTLTTYARTLLDDTDAATARATLDAQQSDATLTALAGLTSAADALPYFTGVDTASTTTLTAYARTLLDDADSATARTTLGAQTSDATLTALAGVTSAADTLPYFTGVDTATVTGLTSFARTLLDDTTAAAMKTTLGLDTISGGTF